MACSGVSVNLKTTTASSTNIHCTTRAIMVGAGRALQPTNQLQIWAHVENWPGIQGDASVSVVYGERALVMHVVEDVQVHYEASRGGVVVLGICVLWVPVSSANGMGYPYTHWSLPQVFVQRIVVEGVLYHLLDSWYVRYA